MSGYEDGRRVEWAVMHDLAKNGYYVQRAASSKGFSDVCGIKPGQVLIVNCKRTTMPGPAERQHVLDVAACLPGVGVPLVALKPLGQGKAEYRRLHGPGSKDWTPWTPDEVSTASSKSNASCPGDCTMPDGHRHVRLTIPGTT
jgi:hypothetical protein